MSNIPTKKLAHAPTPIRRIPKTRLANAPAGYYQIGERIKLAREIRKLSIEECAAAVGVSTRLWKKWESGDTPKLWKQTAAIGRVLGLNLDWLVGT
jgi:DNA-binding transcriptional regulator YiaG